MRNVLLALAVGVAFSGMAQVLNVASIEKVNIPENRDNVVAAISPNGDYLLVTNSAGDNSVLTIQVRLEEYSTYNIQAPALTNYLLYVKAGTRPNLRDNLFGVWISGRATPFRDTRFNPNTDVKIDDSGVFYSMPGIYTAYYSLSESLKDGSRRDLGTAELMIIVEE